MWLVAIALYSTTLEYVERPLSYRAVHSHYLPQAILHSSLSIHQDSPPL